MYKPRTEQTENAYSAFKQSGAQIDVFNFDNEIIVREFSHWIIIKNRFPYDRMARTNDMLVSRKPLLSHYNGTDEVKAEYHSIINLLAEEGFYDALIENFPKVKSVQTYAHTHLVQWHNTTPQVGNL